VSEAAVGLSNEEQPTPPGDADADRMALETVIA
jgi:hypothetical protein